MRANEFIHNDRLDEGWGDDIRAKIKAQAQQAKNGLANQAQGIKNVNAAVGNSLRNAGGRVRSSARQLAASPKVGAAKDWAKEKGQQALDGAINAAKNPLQAADRIAQSNIGQTLGGWSQRLVGVGNKQAAGKQIWMKKFMSMVNNLIASNKDSAIPFNFGNAIANYLKQQRISVNPEEVKDLMDFANQAQENGYQRADILKLADSVWSIGSTASSMGADYGNKKINDLTAAEYAKMMQGQPEADAAPEAPTAAPEPTDPNARVEPTMEPTDTAMAQPTAPKSNVPVGTKFVATGAGGKKFNVEFTPQGVKINGVVTTNPKQIKDLEAKALKSQSSATSQAPVKTPKPKLKAPSALAKGTPGKPATAGKSRIRP